MFINNLTLENIGPFKKAELDFSNTSDKHETPPVIIITGENGTGKSIIVDSIRGLLLGPSPNIHLERDIISDQTFKINSEIIIEDSLLSLSSNEKHDKNRIATNNYEFNRLFSTNSSRFKSNFLINYWSSKLSSDQFNISNLENIKTDGSFIGALSGQHTNNELTKSIVFFDYLSDSNNPNENKIGKKLYSLVKEVIESSISQGYLKYISRSKLLPVISINNKEITLDKLSSGNIFLIQRLVYLINQAYKACINYDIPIEEIQEIKGVLLIDEAENHLHPKWQKNFLKNILRIFPNLQIIVTTHSPFIVSSVENSRVYVCKSQIDHSIVEEETDFYCNKPVEEILMSPLFNTSNFNDEISELLLKRKESFEQGNHEKVIEIEQSLLKVNPAYFNYLNIDKIIKSIKK